ncbi:MAG: hypothetical protein QXW20_08900 [Ignisphaera sp.]
MGEELKIKELINLVSELEKIEKMRIRLIKQSWIDNYNGRSGRELITYGIKITDEELLSIITRVLRILHNDDHARADFIAVTKEGVFV